MKSWKKYLAELIGTFVLVFVACGVAIATECSTQGDYVGYVATALAFGLVIVAMAYSIGNISGCHINPAVSLAMLLTKKMNGKDFVGYVAAQCVGAILGAAALGLLFGWKCGFGANVPQGAGNIYDFGPISAVCAEIILTFIFVLTILGVTSRKENGSVAGLVIGGTLVLVHLLGIKVTGTSVNPARSLGPAIFAGGEALKSLWIFIVAPLVGGALAAAAHLILNGKEPAGGKKKNRK